MPAKSGLILILTLCQVLVHGRQWVPSSMTAAEMWSPATWYYPYGIAAAEAWAEYLKNSQQVTNQLYQQWHATGAANGWWSGGHSSRPPGGPGGLPGNPGGQLGPGGQGQNGMGGQGQNGMGGQGQNGMGGQGQNGMGGQGQNGMGGQGQNGMGDDYSP